MTTVRLAHMGTPPAANRAIADAPIKPALLVSYVYLKPFLRSREKYTYRDWSMDSGAFSAYESGNVIDLGAYTATCKELLALDPTLTEVFALDVIGDWRAGAKNTEAMWKAGVPAIPTFHVHEPWDVLVGLARDYPKIAIGGVVRMAQASKIKWVDQVFARVWPKRIHGLGMTAEQLLMRFPFHSIDASSWEMGPCAYGNWKAFGDMSVRGSAQNLRAEIEYYLKLERAMKSRWAREMAALDAPDGGTLRLALATGSGKRTDRVLTAKGEP